MEKLLFFAFCLYFLSIPCFILANKYKDSKIWGNSALGLIFIGTLSHVGFIIRRIILGGHFPTSNMFEVISFLAFTIVLSFIVIYFIYRTYILGGFVMPIVVILLAYAATFPTDIKPLIPALQSIWLFIHVSTIVLGTGAFGVAFVVGLVYLISYLGKSSGKLLQTISLEILLFTILIFLGYSLVSAIYGISGYEKTFYVLKSGVTEKYRLPPIVAPNNVKDNLDAIWTAPLWAAGQNAASKLNSFLWAFVSGVVLYGVNWLFMRRPMFRWLYRYVKNINLELYDEICYRAIAIGFPLFTLGLIFAMIWAHQAWGRFWGWDPKETWALITWLFYSVYLHLRLSRGWYGYRSAWLSAGGIIIVMINLLVVNLIVTSLHAYA